MSFYLLFKAATMGSKLHRLDIGNVLLPAAAEEGKTESVVNINFSLVYFRERESDARNN
jgi:hypothetical protein